MKKYLGIAIVLLLGLQGQVFGQDPVIYRAYVENHMDRWMIRMVWLERSCEQEGASGRACFELLMARYGYVAYCLSTGKKKDAKQIWEDALQQAIMMTKGHDADARVYSLLGAIHGYGAMMEPLRAPGHGKKARAACDRAIDLDPKEPMAWMEQAHMAHYAPAILGGSIQRAIFCYEEAIGLYEARPELIRNNWLYLNCLAGLGQALEEDGQMVRAGAVYRKLLRMEPGFTWVRDDLYPAWQEKQRENGAG